MHHQSSDSFSTRSFPATRLPAAARLLRGGVFAAALFALGAKLAAGTLFLSNLSGANELTPTIPNAFGLGVIIVNEGGTSSTITTSWHNVTMITGGRIHRGAANVDGPAIFPFATVGNPSAPFTWNLSATALNDMLNGGLYLDLTTAAFPNGVVRGQIFAAQLTPLAANAAQARLASSLDISAGDDPDLDQILIQTNLAPHATQLQTLDDLSARTVYAPLREQIETMAGLTASLFAQADEARANPTGTGQLKAFFRGGDEFGHRSASINQAAAKISRPFGSGGVEYRINETSRGGLAVGYADGQDQFDGNVGQTTTKTTAVQAFLSTQLGDTGVALDGIVGYGWNTIDTTRNLLSLSRTATATFDGTSWSAALKASRAFRLAHDGTLIPYAQIDTEEARLNGYNETGAGAANLVIPGLTSRNSAVEGGVTLLLPIKVGSGVLTARVQAGWRYLFDDGAENFIAALAGSPIGFVAQLDGPGRSAAHVEASLTAALAHGAQATLGYRGELGATGQTTHAVEARLIFRF